MTRSFLRTAACLALSLTGFVAAHAGAGEPSPGAALTRLLERYRAHVLAARPDMATRFGWRGSERRLMPITESTLENDRALLADLDGRAGRIDRHALGAGDAAALDTLRARLATERAPLESGAWRNDPALYLAPGPFAVLEVARAPRVSPCERATRAAHRLQQLPEFLRAAEINLRDTREGDRERATAMWGAVLDSLRFGLPERLSTCHEPTRAADLVEADTLAITSMQRFLRFLSTEWPAGGASK